MWCSKIGGLLFYIISLILTGAVFSCFKAMSLYDFVPEAPLNCLELYWETPVVVSIRTAYWCGVAVQCITAAAVVVLLSACAKKAKNRYAMTGMILSGSVIPVILSETVALRGLNWIHDLLFVFTNKNIFLWMISAVCVLSALGIMRKERVR